MVFGRMFNIWDILILAIIIGYSIYIYLNSGFLGFFDIIGNAIFTAIVIAWIASHLIRRAMK